MKHSKKKKLAALLGIPASLVLTRAVWAQTSTWTGNSTNNPDNLWTDTTNWDIGSVPVSGNTAAFTDINNGNSNISLNGAAQPINTILFEGTNTSYTLGVLNSGDAFNFDSGGAITVNSTVTSGQTINANINTNGSMTVTNDETSSLTLGGNIVIGGVGTLSVSSSSGNSTTLNGNISDTGGSGSVTYNLDTSATAGNSTIAINGSNTYGGTTAINDTAGTLIDTIQIGADSAFSAGKIIVTGGTSLLGFQLQSNNGSRTLSNAIDLNGSMAFTGGNSFNINGPINVINTAGGTSRVLSNGLTSGATVTYGVSTNSASTITLGNPTSNGGDGAGRTLYFGAAANTTTNINDVMQDPGASSGSVGYVGASGAVFNVNSLNTYSGPTLFGGSAGSTVRFNNSYTAGGTSGPFGTGTLVFNNTSSPSILAPVGGGTITLANPIQFLGLAGFTNVAGDHTSLVLNGPISFGTVGRTVTNGLSAGDTLTFGSTLNAQTITMPAANGQTVAFNGAGTTIINDAIVSNGTFTGGTVSFNIMSGTGTVTVNGSLTNLAGNNLQFAGASNAAAVGTINFNTDFAGTGNVNASLSGALNINSVSTYSGGINLAGGASVTTFTTSTTGSAGAVVSGPFGVGTVTFTVNTGGAQVFRPKGGNQTIANAITLAGNVTMANAPSDTSSLALTGNMNMGTAGRTITNNFAPAATLTLGAATSPATITLPTFVPAVQTLVFSGPGATVINDNFQEASGTTHNNVQINAGTGGVIVNGNFNLGDGNVLINGGTGDSVTVNGNFNLGGGNLQFNSGTSGTITVNGNINLAGGNLTLSGVTTATSTGLNILNAPFSGTGSLTIGGSDFQVLNAQNTFTGGTTISGSNVGGVIELPVSSVMSGTSVVSGAFGVNQVTIVTLNSTRLRPINANQLVGNALVLQQQLIMDNNPGDTYGLTFAGPINVATNNVSIFNGFIAGQTAGTLTIGLATSASTITLAATNATSPQTMTFQALNGPIVVNDSMVDGSQMGNVAVNVTTNAAETGLVTFNGASTYSGSTTIGGGTLSISADNNLGSSTGSVTLAAPVSGTLLSTGTFSSARTINLNGSVNVIDATGTNTLSLTGPVGGSGDLTKGTNAGTVQLAQSGGYTTTNNVNVNGGALLLGPTGGETNPFTIGNTLTINNSGVASVAAGVSSNSVTNTATSLVINGSGQLNLANSSLVTTTPVSTIRQYLINGYNGGASNGGGWNGTGGISSVNAAASTNHLTALGYSTGTHSALGIALGLASNQTVVKYTIYGDANLDGSVDISDLDIVLSNYASGKPPSWDTGDFTYAGQTDITDLNIVLSNYAKTAPTSVATPSVARSGVKAASTSSGPQTLTGTVSPAVASGAIELDVNTITGDAVLNPNNAKVVSLQVASSSGNLIPNNWHDLSFYYGTPNWADSSFQIINLAEYDTAYTSRHNSLMLTAPVDYGDIFNTSGPHDLTFEYGIPDADGSDVDTEVGAVVYSTPEPTTLGLMGLAMAGLIGRRRRRKA